MYFTPYFMCFTIILLLFYVFIIEGIYKWPFLLFQLYRWTNTAILYYNNTSNVITICPITFNTQTSRPHRYHSHNKIKTRIWYDASHFLCFDTPDISKNILLYEFLYLSSNQRQSFKPGVIKINIAW